MKEMKEKPYTLLTEKDAIIKKNYIDSIYKSYL